MIDNILNNLSEQTDTQNYESKNNNQYKINKPFYVK